MKLYGLFTYLLILTISSVMLNARENPFIPTKSYIEKKAEMVDQSYEYEVMEKKPEMAEKPMMDSDKKMMKKPHMNSMHSMNMLANGKHNILSFVIIEVNDETLSITTRNQLLKKFDLSYKNTKKIVFDFKSAKGFYSKRADLSSYNFRNIAIGAHPKDGYYRIAISVDDIPSNYDVMYEGNTIHIMKSQM